MRLRSGPGSDYPQLKVEDMTESARMFNNDYKDTGLAFYNVGTVFTATDIKPAPDGFWAKSPSGWICLADDKKVYCEKR